jgi:hypothetical protein
LHRALFHINWWTSFRYVNTMKALLHRHPALIPVVCGHRPVIRNGTKGWNNEQEERHILEKPHTDCFSWRERMASAAGCHYNDTKKGCAYDGRHYSHGMPPKRTGLRAPDFSTRHKPH